MTKSISIFVTPTSNYSTFPFIQQLGCSNRFQQVSLGLVYFGVFHL